MVLWAVGVGVPFIHTGWAKNLSAGFGLGNSLISLLAVILVVENYYRQERRNEDSVIQAHFFQLLSRLPDLLPDDDTKKLRGNSALISQVLRIYFRESKSLGLNQEEILHDLAEHQLKRHVPPGGRFRRQDLLLALEKLRSEASPDLRPLLDQALRATLSDEQRRLLILQAAYDEDLEELKFLGATGVISHVLNEMPELVDFLIKAFPLAP
jgi:hypothetical protein